MCHMVLVEDHYLLERPGLSAIVGFQTTKTLVGKLCCRQHASQAFAEALVEKLAPVQGHSAPV